MVTLTEEANPALRSWLLTWPPQLKLEQPSKRTTTTARSTCVAHSVAFDDKAERAPRGAGSPRAQRGSERQRRALDPGERAAIVEDTSNAEKLCRGSRMNRAGDMRSLALEAEVFGLHPYSTPDGEYNPPP